MQAQEAARAEAQAGLAAALDKLEIASLQDAIIAAQAVAVDESELRPAQEALRTLKAQDIATASLATAARSGDIDELTL